MGTAVVVLAVLGADATTKAWALRQVPGTTIGPAGGAHVRHVTNVGASFGVGSGHPVVVLGLTLAATVLVGWWLGIARSSLERMALAAVMGGALGNGVDRIAHGAVTDWIHVPWYPPTFTLADVAIRAGALVAVAAGLASHRRERSGAVGTGTTVVSSTR